MVSSRFASRGSPWKSLVIDRSRIPTCWILLASAMIWLHSSASWAQVTSGEITGTVMDTTKAVVPGVEVIATNVATGVSRNGLSEANGLYRIPFLQPGSYTVKASLIGFKTVAYDGIAVTVGEIVHVDIILEVGNISETVTNCDPRRIPITKPQEPPALQPPALVSRDPSRGPWLSESVCRATAAGRGDGARRFVRHAGLT